MNFNPRLHPARALLALASLLVLGVAACSLPSSYDVEVGQAMAIQFSTVLEGPSPAIEAVLAELNSLPGVETVAVDERLTPTGTRYDLRLMGSDLDTEALVAGLTARHPVLAGAQIALVPIEQRVEGPLYERLGHTIFGWTFDIELDGSTPAEIEQQIREQLAAQGFEGEAIVDVQLDEAAGTMEVNLDLREEGGTGGQ